MSATGSFQMLFRPTWAVLCSLSVIEVLPYCLDVDLLEACLILTLDVFFSEMVVISSDSRGPSVLACHSCSKAEFLDYLDDSTNHSDVHQRRHAPLLGAWQLYRDSRARAQSKPLELQR